MNDGADREVCEILTSKTDETVFVDIESPDRAELHRVLKRECLLAASECDTRKRAIETLTADDWATVVE